MSKIQMTVDEIITHLKHSSIPTLIVEGKDDHQIYRWIENYLEDMELDIFPCGGRKNLLKVFERKNEYNRDNILFFADRDLWYFTGIPVEYQDIHFTTGYSIENDIYSSAKDFLESLVDDKTNFAKAVDNLYYWFICEVNEHINEKPYFLDISPKGVLDNKTYVIANHIIDKKAYQPLNHVYFTKWAAEDYTLKIRGKNLFELWEWFVEKKSFKTLPIIEIIFKGFENNGVVIEALEKISKIETTKS